MMGEVPVIQGPWRVIAPSPDLAAAIGERTVSADSELRNEPNDHCIFRTDEGAWHLWACVRRTVVGRVLCHWEAASFEQTPWRLTGEIVRCDRSAGESRVDWHGHEFLQSPFVVREGGRWYMFYGGYASGVDPDGKPTEDYGEMENQICLMTSPDGRTWTRHRDGHGRSRVFAGPGAARDPFVGHFQGRWHIYYAGHHDRERTRAGLYHRTSDDLLHWSDWDLCHPAAAAGERYIPESPVVVERDGGYYLFRTHGPEAGCYVFRSDSPSDFGTGGATVELVTRLPVIAPEILTGPDGRECITKINADGGGNAIHVAGLAWREAEEATP